MPASSSSSTSEYRFGCRLPGAFVCASSSTRTSAGRRARIASRSISSSVMPRYSIRFFGTTSRSWSSAAVSWRPCVSTTPTTTSTPSQRRSCAACSIAYVLPTPGAAPTKILSRLRCSCAAAWSSASGDGRRPCSSGRLTSVLSVSDAQRHGPARRRRASLEAPAPSLPPQRRRVDAETERRFLERRRFGEDTLHVHALDVLERVVDGGEQRRGLGGRGRENLIGK